MYTNQEFIANCVATHGDLYDYSKVNYVGALSKVTIICKKHGEFEQFASHHSRGRGCKRCASEKISIGIDGFISRAREIHGDTYDYSCSVFVDVKSRIAITCKDHGIFWQTPEKHLIGRGCHICAGNSQQHVKENIVDKFKVVHGNRYDYTEIDYVRSVDKLRIVCRQHGAFMQSANVHLRGVGCPICSNNSKEHSKKMFSERAGCIHGEKYDYSLVDYNGAGIKVKILCADHGVFEQQPTGHLYGKGCPRCAKTGFDVDKDAYFYLVTLNDKHLGFGITANLKKRVSAHKRTFEKYDVTYNILDIFYGSGKDVLRCENFLKRNYNIVNTGVPGFIEEAVDISDSGSVVAFISSNLTRTSISCKQK